MPPSDRPDDAVINNDAELDRWYDNFLREQARKSGKKGDARFALLGTPEDLAAQAMPMFDGGA